MAPLAGVNSKSSQSSSRLLYSLEISKLTKAKLRLIYIWSELWPGIMQHPSLQFSLLTNYPGLS